MPKKKEETTMLVRAVPLDVSERVRRYCRREGIKRREFLARAIDLLEGPDQADGEGRHQEKVNPLQRVNEIAANAKAYKNAIRLIKDLFGIVQNLNILGDREKQRHIYLEVAGMMAELYEIIEGHIPKHEIPDDPEKMAAMGLPAELIYEDLTEEEWQEKVRRDEEVDQQMRNSPDREDSPHLKELRIKVEETFRQFSDANPEGTVKPRKAAGMPVAEEEPIQPESKAASAESSEETVEKDAPPRPRRA